MVDISTAMAAAAAERKNRGISGDKERKKNRSGADMGIESFDPRKHVSKEKADTASMWLVMCFAIFTALLMRYALMSNSKDNADLLWFVPMMMIFLIPPLHKQVMPATFVEHYTKGTWFKASFLHIFTWLAVTFLLTNPPFGDIVAPQQGHWGVIVDQNGEFDYIDSSKGVVTLESGYESQYWIVLSFTDNDDPSLSEYKMEFNDVEVENTWANISELNESALNPVRDHPGYDYPIVVEVPENLSVGEHVLKITVTEQGSPWENTRTIDLKIKVIEVVEGEEITV
ncbi:MAG: hypothetical protein QGI21_06250 [Candidatus Poseidoniaceae archaeon]|jgi:hypothetical protein|nr:hypothetical protein [Candidatus Poseidoniaceae archaeon]